jgi:DNA-binding NtrC family response regulator
VNDDRKCEPLVGESPCFLKVIDLIPKLASSDATVLILGETGTGKELLAREIHRKSARAPYFFTAINCGALPDELIENELFGHTKGSFTDAKADARGLLAETEGGSIFLDEIDSLSFFSQVKLLRFLQEGEYRPLGAARSKLANVRTIAATNTNLCERVRANQFREDLFHRLNILTIRIPALRERKEDIPLLANYFLTLFGKKSGRIGLYFEPCAIRKMLAYHWPGNVRELESCIFRGVVLGKSSKIQSEDLEFSFGNGNGKSQDIHSFYGAKAEAIKKFEEDYLRAILSHTSGNISRAAQCADIDRRALQRLVKKNKLDRMEFTENAKLSKTSTCWDNSEEPPSFNKPHRGTGGALLG